MSRPGPLDMRDLIGRARKLSSRLGGNPAEASDRLEPYQRRMQKAGAKPGEIVSTQDTAVELGPPTHLSVHALLWTREKNLVRDHYFSLVGPDLAEAAGTSRDYAQLICLELNQSGTDALGLEPLQYFPRLLPGLMARMMPGRLWLRVSQTALAQGLDFSLLAGALRRACQQEVKPWFGVEVFFVTQGRPEVQAFAGLASEAKILAGKHKRIALSKDGEYECAELDCRNCEEKPVCDMIREVRKIRKKGKP